MAAKKEANSVIMNPPCIFNALTIIKFGRNIFSMKRIEYKYPDDYSFAERKIICLTGIDQAWLICKGTLDDAYRTGQIFRTERTRKKNELYNLVNKYLLIVETFNDLGNIRSLEIFAKSVYDAAIKYSGREGISHFPPVIVDLNNTNAGVIFN